MKKFLTIFAIFLFLLANAFAEGIKEKITILPEDQVCEKDEDCVQVETDCRHIACECGEQPVNIKFKEKYEKAVDECRKGKAQILCDMACPSLNIKCVENRCIGVEANTSQ